MDRCLDCSTQGRGEDYVDVGVAGEGFLEGLALCVSVGCEDCVGDVEIVL